jgi:hypothetical protein
MDRASGLHDGGDNILGGPIARPLILVVFGQSKPIFDLCQMRLWDD